MKIDWKKIRAKIKKFVRWFLRRYKKELKTYINEWVDQQLSELNQVISDELRKKIKNEMIADALVNQIDIYTSTGADMIKDTIAEQLSKLEQ